MSSDGILILGSAGGIGGEIARAFAVAHPDDHLMVTFHSDRSAAEALRWCGRWPAWSRCWTRDRQ